MCTDSHLFLLFVMQPTFPNVFGISSEYKKVTIKIFNQTLQYNALSQYIKDFELPMDYIYQFLVVLMIVVQGFNNNNNNNLAFCPKQIGVD
jgi:hypothetical protein